jgi:hypothetical protein
MKSSSSPPSARSTLSTPFTNAASPPVCTDTNESAMRVPNRALSTLLGTQYRARPGSRSGLTTTTAAPRLRARNRYFMKTGWALATLAPKSTMRSESMTSV